MVELTKSAERRKKAKLTSKTRKVKTKSRLRKKKQQKVGSSRPAEEVKKSVTTSVGSQLTVPKPLTPNKERETEKEKRSDQQNTARDRKKSLLDCREKDFKEEKEPESEEDADLGSRKSQVAILKKSRPKKVDIKNREVDEEEMSKLLTKMHEKNRNQALRLPVLAEKDKILMDRLERKSYPLKYSEKNKDKWKMLAADEGSDFFRPTHGKKKSLTLVIPEDKYDNVPKLADVLLKPEENVFMPNGNGAEVPFWAVTLEPDEEEMKDVDPPISVGSDHVEQVRDKAITLKTVRNGKLVLDEFQPLALLTKRDAEHFHPHLIFSNTVRSLINVQGDKDLGSLTPSGSTSKARHIEEAATQAEDMVTFDLKLTKTHTYFRCRPMSSAAREKQETCSDESELDKTQ
ncbi:unnamed protein product [Caenorhabditis sp. 36 PRJEB53466]|nr:unnamed protein product [Caenorhabditis sp. 36 PRJEB53466]